MGKGIVVMKLIISLGYCESDGHTLHKIGQPRVIADRLAPQESDCLRMRSKVYTAWLPRYINTTLPVLEIFKMDGCFMDSLRTRYCHMRCLSTLLSGVGPCIFKSVGYRIFLC
jgi:hypothetical protein